MDNRAIWAMFILAGGVFLLMHAGHIGSVVSGAKNLAPVVQIPGEGSQPQTGFGGSPGSGTGSVTSFTLKSSNGQYDPAVIKVKQGATVRIEGDPKTLTGCMEVVTIPDYGISKLITSADNVIEFTADKAGTFPIHCTMGMGNGRLVVE